MFINPYVMLDLHTARVSDLLAESAHDRLARAVRCHASTAEVDRVVPTAPARQWWWRRIAPS
jgi:hypothetical protein